MLFLSFLDNHQLAGERQPEKERERNDNSARNAHQREMTWISALILKNC